MPLEALVSSRSGLWRSGMLNAQRTVAQMDSCGVQQREIMIRKKSGAFVPPKVSARNIFQPFHIYIITFFLYGTFLNKVTKCFEADKTPQIRKNK